MYLNEVLNMKRLAFALFAFLLLLAGCGDKDSKKEEHSSTQNDKTEKTSKQQEKTLENNKKEVADTTNESQQTENKGIDKDTKNNQQETKQKNVQNQSTDKQANVSHSPSHETKKDLNEASRIALVFFGNDIQHYTITKSEILKGQYEYQGAGMTTTKNVNQLTLIHQRDIPNAPSGMKFYTLDPPKGNFATIIGVNQNKVFVGGTQGALVDYQELLTTGKEMNLQSLYEAYKNDPAYTSILNKIKIVN